MILPSVGVSEQRNVVLGVYYIGLCSLISKNLTGNSAVDVPWSLSKLKRPKMSNQNVERPKSRVADIKTLKEAKRIR